MSCTLTIVGKKLDIDTFISKTQLSPYKKSYKGEPSFKSKPEGEKLSYSLLSILTSEAGFDCFDQQVEDTLKCLKENKDKLTYISSTKEVESAALDFEIDLLIENELCQTNRLPSALLKLAGNLGIDIQLSVYSK